MDLQMGAELNPWKISPEVLKFVWKIKTLFEAIKHLSHLQKYQEVRSSSASYFLERNVGPYVLGKMFSALYRKCIIMKLFNPSFRPLEKCK